MITHQAFICGLLCALVTTGVGTDSAASAPKWGSEAVGAWKPHRSVWLENHGRAMPPRAPSIHPFAPLGDGGFTPDRVVYGYLPYWEINYSAFRWDLLTHVAYFSAGVDAQGNITDSKHWYQPQVESLIADAHAHGVRVTLTVTQFDNDAIGAIVSTPSVRKKLISTLLAMVQDRNADGVNIDFEYVPKAAKADFVAFMGELTQAFHAAIPHSHVSYAGPAVDWSGAYDYAALSQVCDGVFIMGYGYHWGGGSPGPTAPLQAGSIWSKWSLSWTVEDYLGKGGEAIRSHLILGLPFYGRNWPTTGPSIPGTSTGNGAAVFYWQGDALASSHGWQWDEHSSTPFMVFLDGTQWRQIWVDTAYSLGLKFAYANDESLGGIGFWALGYDKGDPALWAEVEAHFPISEPSEEDGGEETGGDEDAGEGDAGEQDAGGEDAVDPGEGFAEDASDGDEGDSERADAVGPDDGGQFGDVSDPGESYGESADGGGAGQDISGSGNAEPQQGAQDDAFASDGTSGLITDAANEGGSAGQPHSLSGSGGGGCAASTAMSRRMAWLWMGFLFGIVAAFRRVHCGFGRMRTKALSSGNPSDFQKSCAIARPRMPRESPSGS